MKDKIFALNSFIFCPTRKYRKKKIAVKIKILPQSQMAFTTKAT